jgi:hypothetical protein
MVNVESKWLSILESTFCIMKVLRNELCIFVMRIVDSRLAVYIMSTQRKPPSRLHDEDSGWQICLLPSWVRIGARLVKQ